MARRNDSNFYPDPSSLVHSRREKVVVPIDNDIAEAVLLIADYFPFMYRHQFIQELFSILLTSLISDDVEANTDAVERIVARMDLVDGRDISKFWGEYMMLQTCFFDMYELNLDLKDTLEDLLPSDIRVWPEELFHVRWSKEANYILIE